MGHGWLVRNGKSDKNSQNTSQTMGLRNVSSPRPSSFICRHGFIYLFPLNELYAAPAPWTTHHSIIRATGNRWVQVGVVVPRRLMREKQTCDTCCQGYYGQCQFKIKWRKKPIRESLFSSSGGGSTRSASSWAPCKDRVNIG